MRKLIRKLANDRRLEIVVNDTILDLFTLSTQEFTNIVNHDLKILVDIIMTYDVIKENLIDILQAVDFREVTIREIEAMDARQIQYYLFNSFGKKIF